MAILTGSIGRSVESVDPVNPLGRYTKPRVIFTFDDVYKSVYVHALPILAAQQMPATVYVATNWASDSNPIYMKWLELHHVVDHYGWEVAAHSMSHPLLENQSPELIELEVRGSKEALEAQGFQPVGFAVPYGSYNNHTLAIIHKYFQYHRSFWSVHDPLSKNELLDSLELSVKRVENKTTVEEMQSWVDQAVREAKTLILVFHNIDPVEQPAKDRWGYNVEDFRTIADYVANLRNHGKLEVMTVQESLNVPGRELLARTGDQSSFVGQVSKDASSSELLTPRFFVRPEKAYHLSLYVDTRDLKPNRTLNVYLEEVLRTGEVHRELFFETYNDVHQITKTYLPSKDVVKARLVGLPLKGSHGPVRWGNFRIIERKPLQSKRGE